MQKNDPLPALSDNRKSVKIGIMVYPNSTTFQKQAFDFGDPKESCSHLKTDTYSITFLLLANYAVSCQDTENHPEVIIFAAINSHCAYIRFR